MLTDPLEAGRRVRAARAYAGLSRQSLGDACGLTLKQVRELEEGTRTVTTLRELDAVAAACAIPREFLHLGWQGSIVTYERIWRLLALVPDVDRGSLEQLRPGVEDSRTGAPAAPRSGPPRGAAVARSGR